jgi:hypothetical protein
MNKNIKDYLHLYLGCEMISSITGEEGFLHSVNMEFKVCDPSKREKSAYTSVQIKDRAEVRFITPEWRLMLRPLSDITEEEAVEVTKPIVVYGDIKNYRTYRNPFMRIIVSWGESHIEKYSPTDEKCFIPEQFHYLLSKHFDLFGLIESGLAIDKTTVTVHE